MYLPQDLIEEIRESNDIVDVISEYVSLQRKGKNYVGLCPFHKEKTPSFSVLQDKQIYHCFGCGEGGNVITFIMKYRNLDFPEAARMLAERANLTIPDGVVEEERSNLKLRESIFNINRDTARLFYSRLSRSGNAVKYLDKRGIGPNIIKKFGLGYSLDSWDDLQKYLSSKGYPLELIEKAGLIISKGGSGYYDRFRNRIMFPVLDIKNRVIGFGGRVLDDSKPKYLNSPETPVFNKGSNLYGLNLAAAERDNKRIVIVEGYMDTIALHQYGITNAVASLGTALTKYQARLLKRYCNEVIIGYDADAAGQAATLRGLDILTEAGCSVKILKIPRGKDPDEFIRLEGKEAFLKCMDNAMPLVEYKIRRKLEDFDLDSAEGKIGFLKACAQVLVEIDDPVVTDVYISKLSGETGISPSSLYEEIMRQKKQNAKPQDNMEKHISGKSRYNNNIDGQKLYLEPASVKAEKLILQMLFEHNELFGQLESNLSCDDFSDIIYRKAAIIIFDKLKKGEDIIPASIIDSFDNTDEMKKVSEIFDAKVGVLKDNLGSIIDDYIKLIHKNRLINRRNEIISKVNEAEKMGNIQISAQLLKDLMEIEKQLRLL